MVTQTLEGNKKTVRVSGGSSYWGQLNLQFFHGDIQFDILLIFLALQYAAVYKSEIVTQLCILKIIQGNDCQIHDLFVALSGEFKLSEFELPRSYCKSFTPFTGDLLISKFSQTVI